MDDRPIGIKILTILYAIGAGIAVITLLASTSSLISGSAELAKHGISRPFLAYTLLAALGLLVWAAAGLIAGERWGWQALATQIVYTLLTNATKIYNATQVHIPGSETQNVKTVVRTGIELIILLYILSGGVLNFFNLDTDERWIALGKACGIAFAVYALQQVIFWIT